jgi:hypothetical protein|tara:strand:- start:1073 stop:1249 length:177 start_codon:yes stop_codon:yes gene_type:complete
VAIEINKNNGKCNWSVDKLSGTFGVVIKTVAINNEASKKEPNKYRIISAARGFISNLN